MKRINSSQPQAAGYPAKGGTSLFRNGEIDHAISQTDLPLEAQILNISVNLARLSQWVFEGFGKREQLINKFLTQTANYLSDLNKQNTSKEFNPTLDRFKKEFNSLVKQVANEENKLYWADKALTWANILQHRAKLA